MATDVTFLPITLIYPGGEDLSDMEATDVVLYGDDLESIDIGGGGALHRNYLRITAPDLIAQVAAARHLLDEIERVVLDARQDAADAERTLCPFCRTVIEDDEETCGAAQCRREQLREAQVGATA